MTEQIKNNSKAEDDEIDLIALAKTIWDERKFLIKTIIVFAAIGVVIALISPKEYSASTTLVPQISNEGSGLGGLSSLAAMAGFNLDMNMETSDLSPYIYPQIVESVPFQLEIMNTPFTFSDVEQPVTIYEYFTKHSKPGIISLIKKYTLGIPGLIIKAIRGKKEELTGTNDNKIIQLTEKQEEIRKMIAENVTLETNDKEGYLILNTRFHEPKLAAEIAQKSQELLQRYITEFKIEKATEELKFIEGRFNEKKKDFELAQSNLAAFRDRNKNVTSAMAQTDEERLQNEFQLSFEVYSELAKQLEQASIKVKKDTPVFAIVKPVTVPIEKSKPKRSMILAIWIFLGGVVGVGWIFGKQFLQTIKTKWNEEDRK